MLSCLFPLRTRAREDETPVQGNPNPGTGEDAHPRRAGRASVREDERPREPRACVPCEVQARPISGGRGSCENACCVLRHGGSAIARLPSPPAASPSMRFRFGLSLCFRKSAALSRVMVATARIVRSYRRRRSGAFRRPRLAGVCGAASARCCRLAPLRPRIRLAIRARRRRERLASPRVRPLPPLHDSIAIYQRTVCTPAREDARPPGWADGRMGGRSPSRLATSHASLVEWQ